MQRNEVQKTTARRQGAQDRLLPLALLIIVLLTAGCLGDDAENTQAPPADYQPLAEVDLSARTYDDEVLGQFDLEEAADVDLFYTLQEIDTPYFSLLLSGPGGDRVEILHSEEFRTDRAGGGSWARRLTPGVYELRLTADQSQGAVAVYWKQQN